MPPVRLIRQIADLVDDEEAREDERIIEPVTRLACLLRLLERRDEIDEHAVADAPPLRRDVKANRQVALRVTGRPEENHVLSALDEAYRVCGL